MDIDDIDIDVDIDHHIHIHIHIYIYTHRQYHGHGHRLNIDIDMDPEISRRHRTARSVTAGKLMSALESHGYVDPGFSHDVFTWGNISHWDISHIPLGYPLVNWDYSGIMEYNGIIMV